MTEPTDEIVHASIFPEPVAATFGDGSVPVPAEPEPEPDDVDDFPDEDNADPKHDNATVVEQPSDASDANGPDFPDKEPSPDLDDDDDEAADVLA